MKGLVALAAVIPVVWTGVAGAGGFASSGNINGTIGYRELDENDFIAVVDELGVRAAVDNQLSFGALADFAIGEGPLWLAAGLSIAGGGDDSPGIESIAITTELSLGLKYMPRNERFRPFIGGGVSAVMVDISVDPDGPGEYNDDDASAGYWVATGLLYKLNPHVNLGLEARYTGGTDLELYGDELDADSWQASFMVGYAWGG